MYLSHSLAVAKKFAHKLGVRSSLKSYFQKKFPTSKKFGWKTSNFATSVKSEAKLHARLKLNVKLFA